MNSGIAVVCEECGVMIYPIKDGETWGICPQCCTNIQAANTRLSERVKELEEENADLADLQYPLKEEHDRAETAEKRVQELEKSAGEILALIHGDGGHYQAEYGTVKALRDAKDKYFECVQKRDRETTQLAARLAQAEGLLREVLSDYDSAPSYLKRYRRVDVYDTQAAEIRTFLHPEQAEKAETIKHIDEVSAEVEQWPEDRQHLLGGFAEGFEKEKL